MSKQYLTAHTVDNAHLSDIFALAVTPKAILSASGSSSINVHDTTSSTFVLIQSISEAHPLGCHHICTSRNGKLAASAGFNGEVKIWTVDPGSGEWSLLGELPGKRSDAEMIWAVALSEDGKFLAGTTRDGKIQVWDLLGEGMTMIREYETGSSGSGSFGMCVDLSRDGKFTASGHRNGTIYVFNNDTGRLLYSLTGLVKPIRTVAFSPGCTRLAAGGDSNAIGIYDMKHGEHIDNFLGHSAWVTSVDWSDNGEFLLSAAMDGKVKVWSVERRTSVATHSESEKPLWAAKWLPKIGRNEFFCAAGSNRSLTFYREATGV